MKQSVSQGRNLHHGESETKESNHMLNVSRIFVLSVLLLAMGTAFAESSIYVTDQLGVSFDQGSPVIINSVTSDGPGWIAIAADDNGKPGEILGYAALSDGINKWIKVGVKSMLLDRPVKVHALLLKDAGTVGLFEYPDKDKPVMETGAGPSTGNEYDKTFILGAFVRGNY
jgi:hypothetical protein